MSGFAPEIDIVVDALNTNITYLRSEEVEAALDAGLDINMENQHGDTLLHLACANKRPELVELLIKRGANINCQNKRGYFPLHLCFVAKDRTILTYLLDHGANIECKTALGETPLYLACRRGFLEVAEVLIAKGADIMSRNLEGNTILHGACSCISYDDDVMNLIKLLLRIIPIDIKNENGDTPLHLATCALNVGIVTFLLKNVAEPPDEQNNVGNTPLHMICQLLAQPSQINVSARERENNIKKNISIQNLLLLRGANPHLKNTDHHTPMDYLSEDQKKTFFKPSLEEINRVLPAGKRRRSRKRRQSRKKRYTRRNRK